MVLGALALGVIALYDAAANGGDWADSLFGGGDEEPTVAGLTPTPQSTVEPTATGEPTPGAMVTPAPQESTATPASAGYLTPEEAIAAFFAEIDIAYVGDCEDANLDTDIGSYCSVLWEDQFDTRIYAAGLAFSEPDTWLLVSRLGARDDWTLVDFAEFPPAPEEPVPPWP